MSPARSKQRFAVRREIKPAACGVPIGATKPGKLAAVHQTGVIRTEKGDRKGRLHPIPFA
jgi:hypothetical protein